MNELAKEDREDELLIPCLVQSVDVVAVDQFFPGVVARTATPHPELRISYYEHSEIELEHEKPGHKRSTGVSESQSGGAAFLASEQPAADGDFEQILPSRVPSVPGKTTKLADQT